MAELSTTAPAPANATTPAIAAAGNVTVSQLTTIAGFTTSNARVATLLQDAAAMSASLNPPVDIKHYTFIKNIRTMTYNGPDSETFKKLVPDAATRAKYVDFMKAQAAKGISRGELSTTLSANYHLQGLNDTMKKYGFDTMIEKANFLSQLSVESAGFRASREYASGAAYEGRVEDLGNTQPGDGVRYAGRGLMQLTGRAVYEQYGNFVGIDAINQPTLLEREPYASDAAGYFVNNYKAYADLHGKMEKDNNVPAITRVINGGRNGLAERQAAFTRAKRVLAPQQTVQPTVRP